MLEEHGIKDRQELSDKMFKTMLKYGGIGLTAEFYPFYDTTHSEKVFNTISLINLNSVKDFEIKIGKTIEFQRFRGNIYVKDLDAWKEREWLGKILLINDIQFKVLKYIPRCSATNLKVNSDDIDINIPSQLKKTYNHMDMGVYLLPLDSGQISEGDKITLS